MAACVNCYPETQETTEANLLREFLCLPPPQMLQQAKVSDMPNVVEENRNHSVAATFHDIYVGNPTILGLSNIFELTSIKKDQ